jgi:AcrR family transcriptional regulator
LPGAERSPSTRPGTAVREKGQRRVEEILDIATNLIIADGYGPVTMRGIADAADIRLSNLQYYFRTKEDLLAALLQRAIQAYQVALEAAGRRSRGSPQARLRQIIEYLLRDQETKASCQIFWEMWALAGRDPAIAKIMDHYYDYYIEEIASAIAQVSPGLGKRKAKRQAGLIVALIEGASLLRGYGKRRRSALAGFERAIEELCQQLAKDELTQ